MLATGTPSGAVAQLGERVLCKHEVVGSIPSGSTSLSGVRSQAGNLGFTIRRVSRNEFAVRLRPYGVLLIIVKR
ncbi:hypothetical protein MTBLM1_20132 [Rhodospirillaceae bacterium LM-1]|nr:hypothetical protein MTBLM1_20132 [Rhodospirillaceae bacterium LM-1]